MDYYAVDFESPSRRPPERSHGFGRLLLAAILGATLTLGGAYGLGTLYIPDEPVVAVERPATAAMPVLAIMDGEFSPAEVAESVVPAVVTVEIEVNTPSGVVAQGSGSGVIIDQAGYIVTNDHVAGNAASIRVILSDGRIYDATLVGTDPLTDLAVLRIEAGDLTAVEFGSTDGMRVGEPAVAIGSPLGLQGGPSLTVGVLSAFGREVQTSATTILYGMLQTDAPITQGSSGGALVDDQGRLIGITTAVGVSSVGIEGIGFATPIEVVQRIVADLLDDGVVANGLLGINGVTDFVDTSDGGSRPTGVRVEAIEPGSGASAAGLQLGDVITAVEGVNIDTMDELISALRRRGAGDAVMLEIQRGGAVVEVTATLGTL
ncbi:MAG: trypsin-like peptidase domain-containing protein [Acidimicrobiia bacterium]|nr:trypsin-like peptidase domain-containing protein [Acidimicrobiia bacterium]